MVKNLPANAGDSRVPSLGWEGSLREGRGNTLQCSCLENPLGRGAWGASPWGRKESDMTEVTELKCFQLVCPTG